MNDQQSKIDASLRQTLATLPANHSIEVIVYPTDIEGGFTAYLEEKKRQGELDYSVLKLANSIALRASKQLIEDIGARQDVARITANPRFKAQ